MILKAIGIAGLALTILWGLAFELYPHAFFLLVGIFLLCWIVGIRRESKGEKENNRNNEEPI